MGEGGTVDYLEPFCALSKVSVFLMREHGRYCHIIGLQEISPPTFPRNFFEFVSTKVKILLIPHTI